MIAKAAEEVAERVGAKYVVAFTKTGDSARRMSRLRGPIPILAFTPEGQVRSQLALSWGVETFKTQMVEHTDEMVRQVDEQLLQIGRVEEGDLVVIIAGRPSGHPRLHERAAHPPDGRRDQRGRPGLPPELTGHRLGPISPSRRATSARRETLIVFQFDWRQATSTRSSAAQHRPRMSAELFVNCHRG